MITTIIAWFWHVFEWLFCKHDYYKVTWRERSNNVYRYSERLYRCEKCGKEKWVHGDFDNINALYKHEKEYLRAIEEKELER